MKKRLIILLIVILVWMVVAFALTRCAPQEEARVTDVATRTPMPTFTATLIPSPTLMPSPTPRPTNTPTSTPVPTNTPIPTDTPAPTNTSVPTSAPTEPPAPTATPTVTQKPTSRPRPTKTRVPQPTNTPPPPFSGTIVRGHPHCGGYAGVTGIVLHASGDPYAGVAVGVWSDIWQGRVGISQADGKYEVTLSDLPPGHYWVAVVQLETCGQADGQWTAVDCHRLSKPIEVTVTEFCEVNRVTEVDFRGP